MFFRPIIWYLRCGKIVSLCTCIVHFQKNIAIEERCVASFCKTWNIWQNKLSHVPIEQTLVIPIWGNQYLKRPVWKAYLYSELT